METVTVDKSTYQIGGIILLVLGILGMALPEISTHIFLWMVGALLILGGVMFFVAGFKGGWLNFLIGIVLLAVGALMFLYQSESLSAMTFILAAWFLLMGVVTIVFAFAAKSQIDGWWSPLITGILSFILGTLIYFQWPENSDWVIGLFIGIELFLDGMMLLVLSMYGE